MTTWNIILSCLIGLSVGVVSVAFAIWFDYYFKDTIKFQWFYFRVLCNFIMAVIGWILSFGINSYIIRWIIDEKEYEAVLPNIETMMKKWKEK